MSSRIAIFEKLISSVADYGALSVAALDDLVAYIPSRARVLEVGSGSGLFTEMILAKLNPTSILCIDPDADACEFATNRFSSLDTVEIKNLTAEELAAQDPSARFDIIISRFAFHHIEHEAKANFLNLLYSMTACDGKLCIIDMSIPHYCESSDRAASVIRYYSMTLGYAECHNNTLLKEDQDSCMKADLEFSGEYKICYCRANNLVLESNFWISHSQLLRVPQNPTPTFWPGLWYTIATRDLTVQPISYSPICW